MKTIGNIIAGRVLNRPAEGQRKEDSEITSDSSEAVPSATSQPAPSRPNDDPRFKNLPIGVTIIEPDDDRGIPSKATNTAEVDDDVDEDTDTPLDTSSQEGASTASRPLVKPQKSHNKKKKKGKKHRKAHGGEASSHTIVINIHLHLPKKYSR